ncbi:hypothetical protein GH714_034928 [Hevea brasiliensis]|uniref:DUF4283 domain-containing protein n=1 Tax=Hevea brasiliensis TaxID=3981 RepID=A0A6A6N8K5_HEVBR|nr:hypothetical protein GH714_034928 [Hevea brasiliensis]
MHKALFGVLGSKLGKVVKVDDCTLMVNRVKFARLIIKLDFSNPFFASYSIDAIHYHIEYENLLEFCFSFGLVGHIAVRCKCKNNDMGNIGDVEVNPNQCNIMAEDGDSQSANLTSWDVGCMPQKGKDDVNDSLGRMDEENGYSSVDDSYSSIDNSNGEANFTIHKPCICVIVKPRVTGVSANHLY